MNPRDQTLVENAWPKIDAAVKAGLTKRKKDQLSEIVAVPSRPADLNSHVQFAWGTESGTALKERKLAVSVSRIHEIRTTETLPIGSLEPQFSAPEVLVKWADETRLREVRWAIEQIAGQAMDHPDPLGLPALDAAKGAKDANQEFMTFWRLVALKPIDHLAELCAARSIEYVDASNHSWPTAAGVALLFRSDTFAMSRLEPFSLTWQLSGTTGVTLTLAERLELIGFTDDPQDGVLRFMTATTLPKH